MAEVKEGRTMMSASRIYQLLMIHMTGGAPFGFRIASVNSDGLSPFTVSMIRISGKAYRAGLQEADLVLAINGFNCCTGLSHNSATKLMEYDDPELTLNILRGENICEDDIKTSLQSLDSQILELTDQEVQAIIAKKQLQQQQHVGIPISTSKHSNSFRHLNVSPFWLQPPPITRPKMVEKRNEMLSPLQANDHPVTDWTPNRSTDNRANQTWTKSKTKAIDDVNAILKTDQLEISGTTESNKALQLSDKPTELKSKASDCIASQKYQLNDAEQQSRWLDLPGHMTRCTAEGKACSQSKLTTSKFDSPLSPIASGEVEKASQDNLFKQLKISDNQLRNRYRVQQNILFKPIDQTRYYDAELGQFRENFAEKIAKRRSNSISSYHMYMSSGIQKASSFVENREHTQKPDGSNHRQPSENNVSQSDGKVYQWANADIKKQGTEDYHGISNSLLTTIQLNPASSSRITNTYMSSSLNFSQQPYPAATLSRIAASNTPHLASILPVNSATTPTDQLQASSGKWETRYLQQSSPICPFSPEVGTLTLIEPDSHLCLASSTPGLLPSSTEAVLRQESSIIGAKRASPTLFRLRSNESEAYSPPTVRTPVLSASEAATAKLRPHHYSGLRSTNHGRTRDVSTSSRTTSTSVFETDQHQTEPVYSHCAQRAKSSFDQRWTINADRNSLKTLLANEGKGGRLFARRRANSDAWIVGEREQPNNSVPKSLTSNITEMQNTSVPDVVPRRRRSFTAAGHLQQPGQREHDDNSFQYRSTTAQRLASSFSSPRPYDGMQYSSRSNSQKGSSAGQSGLNQVVRYQMDLNAWQPRETTDCPMSSFISQRVRPHQADICPLYQNAPEANTCSIQPDVGYTDL